MTQQFQLIGFAAPSYIEEWLTTRDPAHLPLMAYHGNHRVAVFTLKDGVDLAWRGESPQFDGTVSEQKFGDVVWRPEVPTLPVTVEVQQRAGVPDVDALAAFIREVDGNNSMGAAALAERIIDWWSSDSMSAAPEAQVKRHEWDRDGERCAKCGDKDWFAGAACSGRKQAPQPAEMGADGGDYVLVPRGLLGAAASCIAKRREGPETLNELRRYTTGDLSRPAGGARAQLTEGADALREEHERETIQLTEERDQAEEWADKLAGAIAQFTGLDIGEHSNINNPWAEALEALTAAGKHSSITHCDNCGCDWLDNGLNPVGCPYCKLTAAGGREDRMLWMAPPLNCWAICRMNHYYVAGQRLLFVSMTKLGKCITEEGQDGPELWARLRDKAIAASQPAQEVPNGDV